MLQQPLMSKKDNNNNNNNMHKEESAALTSQKQSSSSSCCFGGSKDDDPATCAAKVRSRSIDAKLKIDKEESSEEIKLLLLGAGEAGKSTIFKQIQIIHNKGIPQEDRMVYVEVIHRQVLQGAHMMIDFCAENDIAISSDLETIVREIRGINLGSFTLDGEAARKLKLLWADEGIQTAFQHRGEYHLLDSTRYFFEKLDVVSLKGWIPSEDDIIHMRVKTTGICEMNFVLRNYKFKIIDVGGQRSERRKWIHCFEDVTAVIFVASLSEYDCMLHEEESVNRMHESLVMFNEICNSPWFSKTSIILFLNKKDIFAEKIKTKDLNVCFPEYKGGCDEKAALEYVKQKFISLNKHNQVKQIYVHETCATNTDNIKFVFNAVQDIVLQENLRGSGIL